MSVLPAFDVDGGFALALVRGVSVAALLSVFGSLVFRIFVAAPALDEMAADMAGLVGRRLLRVTQLSLAASLLGLVAWLLVQSAAMANAEAAMQAIEAVPIVLRDTSFGHVVALQILAVLVGAAILGRRDSTRRQRIALGVAAVGLALQAGHSHAASMYSGPSFLLAAETVHLLGAGAWLGGLAPFLLLVRDAPARAGAMAARWFSPMGKLCVVALSGSALFQSWVLVESVPGLVGTAYGWMVVAKLVLFGVLFAFAPALLQHDPAAAKRVLVRSVAVQTGFGLAIVVAASVLSSLPPAMHEQPVWPFAGMFTLDTLGEDPEFRNEAIGALVALAASALLLGAAAIIRHRARWPALAGAVVIAWFAVPHLDLLFVPAYPTSFYHSPTGFAATGIVRGADLFAVHCAMCHGAEGHGDGPAAMGLPVPPADLTAAHLWMHSDGELFWWLTHGIEGPEGGLSMPGFGDAVSADGRWDLIDYVRAHNAGVSFHAINAWPNPVQAPDLQARCVDERTVSLGGLRGGFVRLVIGAALPVAASNVITVAATADAAARPSPGLCIASEDGLRRAYGIVSGLQAAALPGTQFLIDGDGWLRAVQPPAVAPGWNDPKLLAADMQRFAAQPIAAKAGGGHMQMEM